MNKKLYFFCLFLVFSIQQNAHAGRWQACKETLKQASTESLFDFFASLFVTTTSWTTSSSKCRNWTANLDEPVSKEKFFAENFHFIKPEASGGKGDYLETFLSFYDLPKEQNEKFKIQIKNIFSKIFMTDNSVKNILFKIDEVFLTL